MSLLLLCKVLVLGGTGRNFAAGMSGGRAFVLDLDPALVNSEMVDILAVPRDQRDALHNLVARFFDETESQVAAELLADWDEAIHRIAMVMPRDYARVLNAMQRAQAEGIPSDTYVMEIANG